MTPAERTARINEIFGPCPDCESMPAGDFTDEQADAIIERHDDPGIHVMLQDAKLPNHPGRGNLCDVCSIKRHKTRAGKERAARAAAFFRATYRDELIPEAASRMTFAGSDKDIEPPNEAHFARFARGPRLASNLWIYGGEGTSKTYLARCILNRYLFHLKSAGEVGSMRVNEIGLGFHPESDIARYAALDILLIDDIDKAHWHANGIAVLWSLIDKRCTGERRTIITSNEDPQELAGRLRKSASTKSNNSTKEGTDPASVIETMYARMMPIERIQTTGDSARR